MVVAFAGILYIVAAARGEKVIVPPGARKYLLKIIKLIFYFNLNALENA